MNTTGKVLLGAGVVLGGAGIYLAARPKPTSAVKGQCESPVLRAGVVLLDKTYTQALAVARENGGPDLVTCIPRRSGYGVEGSLLYRWAIFVRRGEGQAVAGYGVVGVKVSVAQDGRFSPETTTLEAPTLDDAEASVRAFLQPALAGAQNGNTVT